MAFTPGSHRRRRKGQGFPLLPLVIAILTGLSIILFLYNFVWSSASYHAKETVQRFYELEQAGDFGSAWELFHSQMKEKYPKEAYIQQRALIFMEQLGAKTFQFEIGDTDRISSWNMSEASMVLNNVYKMVVSQRLQTVFGSFTIEQEVFAVKEDGEWKMLWSFLPIS